MSTIVPNIDVYGTHARASTLADVLELQALRSESASVADLADYIKDNNWAYKLKDQFTGVPAEEVELDGEAEDLGEEVDLSDRMARDIFAILRERATILGNRYPYALKGQRLVYRGGDTGSWPYLLCLAITVAHAYEPKDIDFDPRELFESLVSASFVSKGFLVSSLGRMRKAMSFDAALDRVAEECRLTPTLSRAVVRKRAQEEGVDVVAHLDWRDSRPLHWVYIIQATCAMSDYWKQKLNEPSPQMWRSIFGLLVLPVAVLAIPHHLPRSTMHYLLQFGNGERLVVDRLRLSFFEPELLDGRERGGLVSFLNAVEVDFE